MTTVIVWVLLQWPLAPYGPQSLWVYQSRGDCEHERLLMETSNPERHVECVQVPFIPASGEH